MTRERQHAGTGERTSETATVDGAATRTPKGDDGPDVLRRVLMLDAKSKSLDGEV